MRVLQNSICYAWNCFSDGFLRFWTNSENHLERIEKWIMLFDGTWLNLTCFFLLIRLPEGDSALFLAGRTLNLKPE
jgi:hypothetical protein